MTQRYTVKRIPNGDNRVGAPEFLYEILGPGAPEKPIAVEGIATMIRDALEDAAEAVLAEVDEKVGKLGYFMTTVYGDDFPDDPESVEYVVIDSQNQGGYINERGAKFTDALRDAEWVK